MTTKLIVAALALAIPSVAFAAEPPTAPKECCCKKDETSKMACCKDKNVGSIGRQGHDAEPVASHDKH